MSLLTAFPPGISIMEEDGRIDSFSVLQKVGHLPGLLNTSEHIYKTSIFVWGLRAHPALWWSTQEQ